jgi:hypothetical protein
MRFSANCGHVRQTRPVLGAVLGLVVIGCANVTADYADVAGSGGGEVGYAGSSASGGSSSTATGGSAYGGSTNTGGGAQAGGASPSGGNPSGGTPGTGGVPSTGGLPSTGGVATGGLAPVGGWTSVCAAPGYAFCDDFEANSVGGPATEWTAGSGTWSVSTDPTQVAGDQQVYTNTATADSHTVAGSTAYANATIEAAIKVASFSSTSASNAAGIFLRNNGTNEYDLSVGGDGQVYLRRSPTSSTELSCSSGTSHGTGVTVNTSGCSTSRPCTGWFKLKLEVSGTAAAGITITGYVDPTASSGYTQVLQCTLDPGAQYMIDSGTAGVFAKSNAPAGYDDVIITTQ